MQLDRKRIGFALVVALLALAAGIYLSGFLVLLFLKLDTNAAGLDTYYSYFRALDMAEVRPYVGRIKVAGYVGFGLPLLACLALLLLILRPPKKSLHGDARFANAGDLAKKGMFKASDTGIIVGKFNGKLVRLGGQQFVILAAPTRSGKGVGVVIPNLLDYRESIVVLDIKQENFELTSGWRAFTSSLTNSSRNSTRRRSALPVIAIIRMLRQAWPSRPGSAVSSRSTMWCRVPTEQG